jgi:hypothetical protein
LLLLDCQILDPKNSNEGPNNVSFLPMKIGGRKFH